METKIDVAKKLYEQGILLPSSVVAILASDIHLSLTPPVARSVEKDWLGVQVRQLDELRELVMQTGATVFYAGDIFHRWNSAAELINFAITYLPPGFAVPGQHDLPLHSWEDRSRSAYWTLECAGKIKTLTPEDPRLINNQIIAVGFPWGFDLANMLTNRKRTCLYLAVVHKYIWMEGFGHPGAKQEERVGPIGRSLKGFDVAAFGDNHCSFIINKNHPYPNICNPGSFFRRNTDERKHKPMVGLVTNKGKIYPYYLDCSKDKFVDVDNPDNTKVAAEFDEFIKELEQTHDIGLDFATVLRRKMQYPKAIGKPIKEVILQALEEAQQKQETRK